jgi:hypothetical protein
MISWTDSIVDRPGWRANSTREKMGMWNEEDTNAAGIHLVQTPPLLL